MSIQEARGASRIAGEIAATPLFWLLVFVPVVFAAEHVWPERHTLLFLLSVLAIVPLAALLSRATESVAERTGDAVGGLLNATLGNLTELVIALTALQAGQYLLVKASIAGAIVTNTLFMLGGSFLIGGLRYHEQQFNRATARQQSSLLFLAAVALLVPSLVANGGAREAMIQPLSLGLAVILIAAYGLSLVFSLKTHKEVFASVSHGEGGETPWPLTLALITLGVVTVLVAMVSEIFVSSVQIAATTLGMSTAFVGFIVVAIVGAAAEITTAFAAAARNRLDLSVGIALGSAAQIALFVAPFLVIVSYFVGLAPMTLEFWPGAVAMILIATMAAALMTNGGPLGLVHRGHDPDGLRDLRADPVHAPARDMTRPGSTGRTRIAVFCAVACLAAAAGAGISSATTREEAIELCTRELVDRLGAQVVRDPKVRRHDHAPFVYGSADYADATGVRFRCRVYQGKVRSIHYLVSDRSYARGWAWVDERPRGAAPVRDPDATIEKAVKTPPPVVRPHFERPPE